MKVNDRYLIIIACTYLFCVKTDYIIIYIHSFGQDYLTFIKKIIK